MVFEIKQIAEESALKEGMEVIRSAFMTVANEFNITIENASTNPAFIELRHLLKMRDKGIAMFGGFTGSKMAGFVAIEKKDERVYAMERLAVLPKYRHMGLGKKLMDFVFESVKKNQGEKVTIGIINENHVLKNWYMEYGFVETELRNYEHLPFTVCLMEKNV